jgi:predicted  nucleic acid-binding Zn-ribbon protein
MPNEQNYKEQLEKLIILQEADSQLFDLQVKKDNIPIRLKEMDDSLNDKKGGMEQAEEEYKRLQVAKNEKENEMQTKEEKIKKHDGELYQIKNNKEYKALQDEIDSIKADVSLIEEDIIRFFDEIEAAQKKLDEEKKIFEDEKNAVEKEKQTIKTEEQELTKQLGELNAKREECVKSIDSELLTRYARILEKWGRVALARVEGEFCGECNMQLRPQIINEVRQKKKPVFCENCVRILYEKED